MAERGATIERRLRQLGAELDAPAPDLAAGVRSRLERESASMPPRQPHRRRAVAIGFAALLLGAGSAYAASSEVRDAVRDLLGIGAVELERVPELPPVRPDAGLGLGRPIDPASAARESGFTPLDSSSDLLGDPDGAFMRRAGGDAVVSFVYRSGPELPPLPAEASIGLVLTQVDASLDPAIVKTVLAEAPIEIVRIAGAAGYWIGGDDHVVAFPAADPPGGRRRPSANVLLWSRDGITLRLEAEIPKARALRLARTIR